MLLPVLWQKRYKEWVQPAISYSLFAVMILGTGVIMGSFWAYESLNFDGFWAWDPVENAALIPWLTLIGGGARDDRLQKYRSFLLYRYFFGADQLYAGAYMPRSLPEAVFWAKHPYMPLPTWACSGIWWLMCCISSRYQFGYWSSGGRNCRSPKKKKKLTRASSGCL